MLTLEGILPKFALIALLAIPPWVMVGYMLAQVFRGVGRKR